MKKLLILLIIPFLSFGSEPKEGEESSCLLLGTWSFDYIEPSYTNYVDCLCEYSSLVCDNILEECAYISFLDNGLFEAITLDGDLSGTWSSGCVVGDSIFLESFEPDSYEFFIISISEENLVFSENENISYLSKSNSTTIIETPTINKDLLKTIDILGRETTNKGLQLHIYDDGSVEKKYLMK